MPDMSKFSEIVYQMQNDVTPEYSTAVAAFLKEGFPTEMLLSIIKRIQQPNSALINSYLYICQSRNEPIDMQMQKMVELNPSSAQFYNEIVNKRKLLEDLDAIIAQKKQ